MTRARAEQDPADFARVLAELRERWPESRLDPSLDRIRALTDVLGDPQRSFPVIHVAGTNGKTTTTRIIDAILRGFGLRVGRFTSPDLVSPTERISLDGEPISERRSSRCTRTSGPTWSWSTRTSRSRCRSSRS